MSDKKLTTHSGRYCVQIVALVLTLPLVSRAASVNLGQAGGFTVLSVTNAGQIVINGGAAVVGDVGVPTNGHLDLGSGAKVGPGPVVAGNIFVDTGATVKLDNETNPLIPRDLSGPIADAVAANMFYASLPPVMNLGSVDVQNLPGKSLTLTGNGGNNVYSVSDFTLAGESSITLAGGPNDLFVFNITGTYKQTDKSDILLQGIGSDQVLFNFIGTGNPVQIGQTDSDAFGIYLAPQRDIDFTDATLGGRVIGDGSIKIASKMLVIGPTTTTVIPLPPAAWTGLSMLAVLLVVSAITKRRCCA